MSVCTMNKSELADFESVSLPSEILFSTSLLIIFGNTTKEIKRF